MYSFIFFVSLLAGVSVSDSDDTWSCGICDCSSDLSQIICAGVGFTSPPHLPKEALLAVRALGLQRNRISMIPLSYLRQFKRLAVVDIRAQVIPRPCVEMNYDIPSDIKVIGK